MTVVIIMYIYYNPASLIFMLTLCVCDSMYRNLGNFRVKSICIKCLCKKFLYESLTGIQLLTMCVERILWLIFLGEYENLLTAKIFRFVVSLMLICIHVNTCTYKFSFVVITFKIFLGLWMFQTHVTYDY